MKHKRHLLIYIFSDYLAALFAWYLFFFYRKIYIESPFFGYQVPLKTDARFFTGLFLIPFFWLFLHFLTGYYRNVLRKSRLKELAQTFTITLFGVILLYFAVILNDVTGSFTDYYKSVFVLFILQFLFTYVPRFIHSTLVHHLIISGPLAFRTLLIGNIKEIKENLYYLQQNRHVGNLVVGVVPLKKKEIQAFSKIPVPVLGDVNHLSETVRTHQIEEVILAFPPDTEPSINVIINQLIYLKIIIKAMPTLYPALLGKVKIQPLFDVPYLQINYILIPVWQIIVKTVFDYLVALLILVSTFPFSVIIAIIIKVTSKGPVIYTHERIGWHGKPFTIYKFRTMVADAEKNGPALSSRNDPRITRFGRFLRKTRLDELPNFVNVLKGEMSIVGPRPERKFYIDQILKLAPDYIHLQKIKPGITSWGQVQYGYAENIEQMIERLQYDLSYFKNMSLYVDFKILILTILTILKRKGK